RRHRGCTGEEGTRRGRHAALSRPERKQSMGFEALIEKVQQAEAALEAQERSTAADWRQFSNAWRSLWTPGRSVLAGLASGLAVGSAEPLRKVGGGGALQLASAL